MATQRFARPRVPATLSPPTEAITHASVLALAQRLKLADQKALLADLSLLVQSQATQGLAASRDYQMWCGAVADELQGALGASDAEGFASIVLQRLDLTRKAWPAVEALAKDCCDEGFTVAERAGVYRLLAGMLLRRAKDVAQHTGAPLTTRFVMGQAQELRAIFDAAFPGYLAAGWGRIVGRRAQQGRQAPE